MSDPIERTQAIPISTQVGRIATQNRAKKVRDDGKNPFDKILKKRGNDSEDKEGKSKSNEKTPEGAEREKPQQDGRARKGHFVKSSSRTHADSSDWDNEVRESGFIIDVKA